MDDNNTVQIEQVLAIIAEVFAEFVTQHEDDIIALAQEAVDQYYESYRVFTYKRLYRLKNKDLFALDPEDLSIHIDLEKLDELYEEEDGDYMYWLTFEHGYHGGHMKKDWSPDTKAIPYWRTPYPKLNKWGMPAKQTTAIITLIQKLYNPKLAVGGEYFTEIVNACIARYGGEF